MTGFGWRQPVDYAQRSACGRYSVCSVRSGTGRSYEAWRTPEHPAGASQLQVGLPTAAAARAVCEEDANGAG